jgi:membrane-bound lytic murein transglycosylase B
MLGKIIRTRLLVLAISTLGLSAAVHADYSQSPLAEAFMVNKHGYTREEMIVILKSAQRQDKILELIARPAEKAKPWKDYRKIFIDETRIDQAVEFYNQHRATFDRAQKTYGVPPEIILGILGVETRFGRHMGKYRVVDSLSTLAFDYPKRSPFFTKELREFLIMAKEDGFDPLVLTGSYAGAMGYGQFMPSSYRAYAVDFNGDTVPDIFTNPDDAIGSIANYFAKHGWQDGEPVATQATVTDKTDRSLIEKYVGRSRKPDMTLLQLKQAGYQADAPWSLATKAFPFTVEADDGQQVWLATNNFYVITRYNASYLYAMAVNEISERIKAKIQ